MTILKSLLTGAMAAYFAVAPLPADAKDGRGTPGIFVDLEAVGERAEQRRAEGRKTEDQTARRGVQKLRRRAYNLREMIINLDQKVDRMGAPSSAELAKLSERITQLGKEFQTYHNHAHSGEQGTVIDSVLVGRIIALEHDLAKYKVDMGKYHHEQEERLGTLEGQVALAGKKAPKAEETTTASGEAPVTGDVLTQAELEERLRDYATREEIIAKFKDYARWALAMENNYGTVEQFAARMSQFNQQLENLDKVAKGLAQRLAGYDELRDWADGLRGDKNFTSFRNVLGRVYGDVTKHRNNMVQVCNTVYTGYLNQLDAYLETITNNKNAKNKVAAVRANKGQSLQEQLAQLPLLTVLQQRSGVKFPSELLQAEKNLLQCSEAQAAYDTTKNELEAIIQRNLTRDDTLLRFEAWSQYIRNRTSGVAAGAGVCVEGQYGEVCVRLGGIYNLEMASKLDNADRPVTRPIGENLFRTTTSIVDEEEHGSQYHAFTGSVRALLPGTRGGPFSFTAGVEVAAHLLRERITTRTQTSSQRHDGNGNLIGDARVVPEDGPSENTLYSPSMTVVPSLVLRACYERVCLEGSVGYDLQLETPVVSAGPAVRF